MRITAIFLVLLFFCSGVQAQERTLRVAAAADLTFALKEIAPEFERRTGAKVSLTFGSSGTLFAQIQNGAPFDLYFAADMEFPRRLEAFGHLVKGSIRHYATGTLVLWVPKNSILDLEREGMKVLADSRVRRIAIANPRTAPYGRAAAAAIRRAGLEPQIKGKLAIGDNVAQAANMVVSTNADLGMIGKALAMSPEMSARGRFWIVPQELYPELQQGAGVVASSKQQELAREFLDFVTEGDGRGTLASFGFEIPSPAGRDRR